MRRTVRQWCKRTNAPEHAKSDACQISLVLQTSKLNCCAWNVSFGCGSDDCSSMWVVGGCRGVFSCRGRRVRCGHPGQPSGSLVTRCRCIPRPLRVVKNASAPDFRLRFTDVHVVEDADGRTHHYVGNRTHRARLIFVYPDHILPSQALSKLGLQGALRSHASAYACDRLPMPSVSTPPDDDGRMHIAFLDTRRAPNWEGIMRVAAQLDGPHVHFHVIVAPSTHHVSGHTAPHVPPTVAPQGELLRLEVVHLSLPRALWCVYEALAYQTGQPYTHSMLKRGERTGGLAFLLKPFVPWMLPHLRAVLMLDTDIIPLGDVAALWHHRLAFHSFMANHLSVQRSDAQRHGVRWGDRSSERAERRALEAGYEASVGLSGPVSGVERRAGGRGPLIGLVPEQSTWYSHFGLRHGWNGGVALLDLEGMRGGGDTMAPLPPRLPRATTDRRRGKAAGGSSSTPGFSAAFGAGYLRALHDMASGRRARFVRRERDGSWRPYLGNLGDQTLCEIAIQKEGLQPHLY